MSKDKSERNKALQCGSEEEAEELPTNENNVDLLKLRHTFAHVMAMAVQQTFPEAQVTIGSWIPTTYSTTISISRK